MSWGFLSMEGVGGDTMVGGCYCLVKGFASLEVSKESIVKKFLSYNDYVLFSCLLGIFASDLPKLFLHTVRT